MAKLSIEVYVCYLHVLPLFGILAQVVCIFPPLPCCFLDGIEFHLGSQSSTLGRGRFNYWVI